MSEIPGPSIELSEQLFQSTGQLEEYLLSLSFTEGRFNPDSLILFGDLSESLTSGGIEEFINDLQIRGDKLHPKEEYGGWIHLGQNPSKLLFPLEPTCGYQEVGTNVMGETIFRPTVEPPFSTKPYIHPISLAHSHFSSGTFSAQDLYFLARTEGQPRPLFLPLSTPQFNFLLLKTKETPPILIGEFSEAYGKSFQRFYEEALQADYTYESLWIADRDDQFDKVEAFFDWNANEYFAYLLTTAVVSSQFKTGLYISKKDGVYNRLTEELAREIFSELYRDMVSSVS